jgi:hypothetical protein
MNIGKLGMKTAKVLGKPVSILFGSDEKGWFTLTAATGILYLSGFPDAAIISAVYSTIFAYSTMQEMQSAQSSSSENQLEDIEGMMDDALSMAEDFQEEQENGGDDK